MLPARFRSWLASSVALTLACALPLTAHAQQRPPFIRGAQQLMPTDAEVFPTPGEEPRSADFGASIALRNDVVLIGMPALAPKGRVAVMRRDVAGQWQRTGSINPVDWVPTSQFGARAALGSNRALVGSNEGVDVYRRSGNTWSWEQRLVPFPGDVLDGPVAFGQGWAIVGATRPDQPGIVQVYARRDAGIWRRVQTLSSGDGQLGDGFGRALTLSHHTLVVGAAGDNQGQGAAYVFKLRNSAWRRTQKLLAIDGAPGDAFGASVAIGGGAIAVGATRADFVPWPTGCGSSGNSGGAYVFRPQAGVWAQQQRVTNLDTGCWDAYGSAVAVSTQYLVVAARGLFPDYANFPIVYRLAGGTYQPIGSAVGEDVGIARLALNETSLLVGHPVDRYFRVGQVWAYRVDALP
jgi:hypothetical protein